MVARGGADATRPRRVRRTHRSVRAPSGHTHMHRNQTTPGFTFLRQGWWQVANTADNRANTGAATRPLGHKCQQLAAATSKGPSAHHLPTLQGQTRSPWQSFDRSADIQPLGGLLSCGRHGRRAQGSPAQMSGMRRTDERIHEWSNHARRHNRRTEPSPSMHGQRNSLALGPHSIANAGRTHCRRHLVIVPRMTTVPIRSARQRPRWKSPGSEQRSKQERIAAHATHKPWTTARGPHNRPGGKKGDPR